MQVTAQSLDKLQDDARPGFDDRFHYQFSLAVHHCDGNRFFVHVHADILNVHKGAPFGRALRHTQNLPQRGALL
jgi:hypothetical protein